MQNGEVKFAPIMDEWKEMIRYYNRLYKEGLLDFEAFTHNEQQFNAKKSADTSIVGVAWSKTNPFKNQDEYIAIAPVRALGYNVVWRIHPGKLGIKNQFAITNRCINIEAAMKWVDSFYTEEATLQNWYGPEGEVFTKENGMYRFNQPEEGKTLSQWATEHTINGVNMPGIFYEEELGTLVEENAIWTAPVENYKLYQPYLDPETWPRPYYSSEDTARISELRTDLFNVVEQNKANWIVGNGDIEAEWEQYVQGLKNIGVQEYIDINQRIYNEYRAAMDK